jgi:hypothetical protein
MLTAATLVVGGTFATTTPSAAFAYMKKGIIDKGNGNTIAIQNVYRITNLVSRL